MTVVFSLTRRSHKVCGKARKSRGATNKRPSIRSKRPPWPGKNRPESFTPKDLLRADSKRSPPWLKREAVMHKKTREKEAPPSISLERIQKPNREPPIRPITPPSRVFVRGDSGSQRPFPQAASSQGRQSYRSQSSEGEELSRSFHHMFNIPSSHHCGQTTTI